VVKVQNLRPSKKRYSVTFLLGDESEVVFEVSEDLVVEYRLVPGKVLEDFAFRSFQKDAETDGAYQRALVYGIRYPQTVQGMKEYLRDRKVSEEAVETIVAKLEKLKVLDDAAYAALYVEDHFHHRHEGKIRIAFDLKQKGLSSEGIAQALESCTSKDETLNLNLLFDRKIPSLKDRPQQRAMMLMSQYLMSRGYDRERVEAFVSARSGIFAGRVSDEELIVGDYREAVNQANRAGLTGRQWTDRIIHRLMQKGYRYPAIKKQLERGESDERQDVGI
jgi:regulatory protein